MRWSWLLALLAAACGGSSAEGSAPATGASDAPAAKASGDMSPAQQKLQGTWEIVRYQSDRPIP